MNPKLPEPLKAMKSFLSNLDWKAIAIRGVIPIAAAVIIGAATVTVKNWSTPQRLNRLEANTEKLLETVAAHSEQLKSLERGQADLKTDMRELRGLVLGLYEPKALANAQEGTETVHLTKKKTRS